MGMEKEDIAKEVARNMVNLNAMHLYALGQIQALEVALGECLRALQSQPELINQIHQALSARHQLQIESETSLPLRDGYVSMQRVLNTYMGEDSPGSVHIPPAGSLN